MCKKCGNDIFCYCCQAAPEDEVRVDVPGYKVECSHARDGCGGCRHQEPHLPVAEDEGECHEVYDECVFHSLARVKCVPSL